VATLSISGKASAQQQETPPATTNPPAQAPGAPPAATEPARAATEEIVVTGSRIRRKDLTTPAPVTVVSREQITSSGIASIGDFLQQMPEQAGALNTNVNNGGDGQTQISLRNLGSQRTLVLVDGKRWVNGGSGAGTAVDLNSIPTSSIERIEILKDGASAVYGSDAIAGVVNLITRKRVSGTELSAYGGLTPHGDAQQYDISLISGASGDRGSFFFTAGYFDQNSMLANNRDWARSAIFWDFAAKDTNPAGSSRIPNGRYRVSLDPAFCTTTICADMRAKFGSGTFNFTYDPTSPLAVDGYRKLVSRTDIYNYQYINYLITPSTRISLFSNGDYHIGEYARAYVQGSFVNRKSNNQIAPEPLDTRTFNNGDGTGNVAANNAYNPFGQQLFDVRRRLVELGPRQQGYDLDTIRAVAGMDGTLPAEAGPLQGLFWDISFNYGRTSGVTTTQGSLNTTFTQAALGPSYKDPITGALHCGTLASGPIPNCTPVDLFHGAGAINTPDQITALGGYKGINQGWTQIASVQANLSKELFTLFSERPVGLAAGYEYRSLYGGFIPNAIAQQQNDTDYNSFPTQGSYHVNEGYGEVSAPLISNVPGAEDVEAQAAVRAYNYNTFGSGATYKFGVRWRPIRDFTLRGTYSTGFRAPDVSDLYGGNGPSAESASDPCAGDVPGTAGYIAPGTALYNQCVTGPGAGTVKPGVPIANNGDSANQINSTVGGSTKLQPEKAKIGTVGLVIEPTMVKNLSVTVDYYNITVTDQLGFNTTQTILNGCYPASIGLSGPPDPYYCSLITRSANTGQIGNVIDLEENVGNLWTQGIDFAARYAFPTTDFGRFALLFDGTYLLKFDYSLGRGIAQRTFTSAGNYDAGSGTSNGALLPRVKFNAGVNYAFAGFNAALRTRFIGSFEECANALGTSTGDVNGGPGFCTPTATTDANGNPFPRHKVLATATWDLYLSYTLAHPVGKTTLAVGVRNMFDTRPPSVFNAFLTYTDPGYDLVGRFVYGRVTHAF
jgi:outer membrane receptor protein involved in Fe transport